MAGFEDLNRESLGRFENYNPVTITATESIGTMALALISLILLFALLRSQRRIRELQERPGTAAAELANGSS